MYIMYNFYYLYRPYKIRFCKISIYWYVVSIKVYLVNYIFKKNFTLLKIIENF